MAAYKLSESLLRGEAGLSALSWRLTSYTPEYSLAHRTGTSSYHGTEVTPPNSGNTDLATPLESNWPYICVHTANKVPKWKYVINPAYRHQRHILQRWGLPPSGNAIGPIRRTNLEKACTLPRAGMATLYCDDSNVTSLLHRVMPSDSHMTSALCHVTPSQITYLVPQSLESRDSTSNYVATPFPTPQSGRDLPSPAQLSVILLKLREELPAFFSGHHTYSMYSSDLVFTNNLFPFSCKLSSRWSYRCFLASSTALLRVCYSYLNLDLLRITKDVDRGKIEARWRLKGRSRLRLKNRVILDGYSEFRVSPKDGCISHHHMDCMMPAHRERLKVGKVLSGPLNLLPKQTLSQPDST